MPLTIHPREERTRKAENELRLALSDIVQKHHLTEGEALRIVNAALCDWVGGVAKYSIRAERHGNSSTPGGFEPDCQKGGSHEWAAVADKPIRCKRCRKLRSSL